MTEVKRVYLPPPNQLVRPEWTEVHDLLAFILAIFSTAQNYRDNTQSALASYRERIVQVSLAKNEGGLNLDMPQDVLERMEHYGAEVATELSAFGAGPRFQEHQWVRLRVLMAQLEQESCRTVQHFAAQYGYKHSTETTKTHAGLDELFTYIEGEYQQLIDAQLAYQKTKQPWYTSQDQAWCCEAVKRMKILLTFMKEWEKADIPGNTPNWPPFFNNTNVPVPPSVLRVTPEL